MVKLHETPLKTAFEWTVPFVWEKMLLGINEQVHITLYASR